MINRTNFLFLIYFPGGGEDIYGNGSSTGQPTSIGNIAVHRDVTSISSHFSPSFASSDGSSPGSTAPRRPPRSKHDLSLSSVNGGFPVSPTIIRKTNGELNQEADHVVLPSKEAPSRLLIGTKMLQGSQSNKYLTNNTPSYTLQSPFQSDTNGRNYCSKGVKTTDDVKLKKAVVRITKYYMKIICKISNTYY